MYHDQRGKQGAWGVQAGGLGLIKGKRAARGWIRFKCQWGGRPRAGACRGMKRQVG